MCLRSPYFYNIPYLIIYISFVFMTHHFSLSQWKINKVIASRREPWEWPAFYFPLFSLTHAFQSHVCLSTFLWLSLIKITWKFCYFWLGKPGKPGMLFWKVLTTMMIYNHLFQSNYKTTSIVKPSTVYIHFIVVKTFPLGTTKL